MKIHAQTHIGLIRKKNEDRYLVKTLSDDSILLAVVDGLGGEVAGGLAADIILNRLDAIEQIERGAEKEQLHKTALDLDTAVYRRSRREKKLEGMGSTLTCMLIRDQEASWVHVGDSRLYYLRKGLLHQVTEDQTLARFLLEEGEIKKEEYSSHYSRHIMDQCVGCGYSEPETGQFRLEESDMLLLATDGLHKSITAQAITAIISEDRSVEDKVHFLVKAALEAGGRDNITIILAEKRT